MASDNAKGKSPTAAPGQSVLGSLPSTRPARMSRRRDAAAGESDAGPARSTAAATAEPEAPKPRAAKPKPAPRKSAKQPKPKAAAKSQGGADRPRAVRSGSPSLKPGPKAVPPSPQSSGPPSGTELVTTAVQAAGELAQIGLSIGGRAVKRAVSRIPKP